MCKKRIRSLGCDIVRMRARQGNFSALVFDVGVRPAGNPRGPERRLVYKQPPPDRTGEIDLIRLLRPELGRWLPDIAGLFEERPAAIVTAYAGEPLVRSKPLFPRNAAMRRKLLEKAALHLADLHLGTAAAAERWAAEGRVAPYAYARDWADRTVDRLAELSADPRFGAAAGGVVSAREADAVSDIVESFYAGYSDRAMRGPRVLTHGDPHWGNVLSDGTRITLIDWEWCNVASPMRDAAILLQEEPEPSIFRHIVSVHANALLQGGLRCSRSDLMHDFYRMMVDNALMMLGWEAGLCLRGLLTPAQFRASFRQKFERAAQLWDRIRF